MTKDPLHGWLNLHHSTIHLRWFLAKQQSRYR
jgi:hypothetical protein